MRFLIKLYRLPVTYSLLVWILTFRGGVVGSVKSNFVCGGGGGGVGGESKVDFRKLYYMIVIRTWGSGHFIYTHFIQRAFQYTR